MRQFLLALTLPVSSTLAAHAQAGCPPKPVYSSPYVNSISTTPSTVYAYTPFTYIVQICNITPTTSYTVAVDTDAQFFGGPTFKAQGSSNADGIVTIPVGAQSQLSAGPYIVGVSDKSVPFVGIQTGITIASTPAGPLDQLIGPYTFLFQGATTSVLPPGASTQTAVAGSFTSDGQGHITAGEADVNSPFGISEQIQLTGSYNYDATGEGTLTFLTSTGTQTFSLTIDPASLSGPYPQPISNAVFASSQGGAFIGSGTLQSQQLGYIGYPYSFTLQLLSTLTGETPCNTFCVDAGYHTLPLSASASLLFTNPAIPGDPTLTQYPTTLTATYDLTFGASVVTGLTESGTLGAPDNYGRSVLTITPPVNYGSPSRFAVYLTTGQFYDLPQTLLSLDPHDKAVLLSGEAYHQ